MGEEAKTNLKTTLGIVGIVAVWADPKLLTWVLFAVIVAWVLWISLLPHLDATRLRKRSRWERARP
jgi:hypothetical protein